jgi:hypothetical protein
MCAVYRFLPWHQVFEEIEGVACDDFDASRIAAAIKWRCTHDVLTLAINHLDTTSEYIYTVT